MVVLDEYKQQLQEQKALLAEAGKSINPEELKKELAELESQMGANDFWNDVENANKINQRAKILQNKHLRILMN